MFLRLFAFFSSHIGLIVAFLFLFFWLQSFLVVRASFLVTREHSLSSGSFLVFFPSVPIIGESLVLFKNIFASFCNFFGFSSHIGLIVAFLFCLLVAIVPCCPASFLVVRDVHPGSFLVVRVVPCRPGRSLSSGVVPCRPGSFLVIRALFLAARVG